MATIGATLARFVAPLARELREAGMFTVGVSGSLGDTRGFDRVYELPDFRRQPPHRVFMAARRLFLVVRRERPAVLHLHTPAAIVVGRIVGLLTGTPVIASTHGTLLDAGGIVAPAFVAIEALLARISTITLTENEDDAKFYRRITAPNSVLVAPVGGLGVDVAAISRAARTARSLGQIGPKTGPSVVAVGRLTPEKNLDDVVAGFLRVREHHPGASLTFVGSTLKGERAWCVPDLPGVSHVPWVDDPFPLVAAADVLVSASRREGFGMVVAESLLLGTPVVAVRNRGTAEVERQHPVGLILTASRPDKIASAIESAWGFGRVDNRGLFHRWSRENAIDFHSAVIKSVLDGSPLPGPYLPHQ